MEGKEVRFGIANTALWATVTTDASCGAINGWHDSFTALGGMVPLANMMVSEVVFAASAPACTGILIYIVLAVFMQTDGSGVPPSISARRLKRMTWKMAMLVVLVFPLVILGFAAISTVATFGTSAS